MIPSTEVAMANYWDDVYKKKGEKEVSWFQENPDRSLEMIEECQLDLSAPIIDIGGGDSRLVDCLIAKGFKDITVLDISAEALARAKTRLKENVDKIRYICSDVTKFRAVTSYCLWHDRAAFHFLTEIKQVESYLQIANEALVDGGFLIVSTFSKTGPTECSGLTISQYSQDDLKAVFGQYFSNTRCVEDTHTTPWGTHQNFVYCGFKKEKIKRKSA